MITHRIIYALTFVAALLFYIFYPPWLSWYLLVMLLLLLPLDLLISLPGMLTKGILLSVPTVVEKDADTVLALIATHTKSFPIRCIHVKLHVSGDDFSMVCRFRCPAEKDGRREVAIDTSRSGLTSFEIKRSSTVSLLGLFTLPISAKSRKSVLVLPPPIKPANTVALQQGILLRPKPGGGFSEEHDMRAYRQGDPVKSIHWKVSAKFDSLIIREPLVPPPHTRLLHVMKWKNAAECDVILGRLIWISEYMLKWKLPYYIKFGDDADIVEIKQDTDLIDYLFFIMDDKAKKIVASDSIPRRFAWVFRIDARAAPREWEVGQ